MGLLDLIKQNQIAQASQAGLTSLLQPQNTPFDAMFVERNPQKAGQIIATNLSNYAQSAGSPEGALDVALNFAPFGVTKIVSPKTQYEIAQDVAQRNATLPVSEGGLGLPANNTAMDRAKAMGYTTKAYHGTLDDKVQNLNPYFYSAQNPEVANSFANPEFFGGKMEVFDNPNVMPLLINKGKTKRLSDKLGNDFDEDFTNSGDFTKFNKGSYTSSTWSNGIKGDDYYLNYNPSDVRSRFAAFDPFRRNEADILAGLLAVPASKLMKPEEKKRKPK